MATKTGTHPVFKEPHIQDIFDLMKANALRGRRTIVMIVIRAENETGAETASRLRSLVRSTDVLFETDRPDERGVLLPMSGTDEAKSFLNRLFRMEGEMKAAILEIFHPDVDYQASLRRMQSAIGDAEGRVTVLDSLRQRPDEEVKVSILDPEPLFRDVLGMAIDQLDTPGIQLKIETFGDGRTFLESGWTVSAHPHLVVMNDLLPRQNGLDVLHELRSLPNDGKFTILMMTRRNSEEDMTYAYESGADGFLVKPFNLRLFEAQIKRLLARLWS
ncbi:Response regulator receiver domain-containing protein [Bhargavaea beijingensis]|uniref:Response regulator receiver domain-containing protein n=1 Tax=Bhargavaea beijingensis TaxID=426756 RepID=A0A1G7A726_9BACL|nr:response regulator [Bhargavaea beijingensis]SDE10483.1 Response regulator receiver domain-containing protein [Bhargavaea beijingensis]